MQVLSKTCNTHRILRSKAIKRERLILFQISWKILSELKKRKRSIIRSTITHRCTRINWCSRWLAMAWCRCTRKCRTRTSLKESKRCLTTSNSTYSNNHLFRSSCRLIICPQLHFLNRIFRCNHNRYLWTYSFKAKSEMSLISSPQASYSMANKQWD